MTISTITPYFGALYQEDLKTYSAKIGVQKKALTATELKIRYAQLANTSDIVILVSEPGSSINDAHSSSKCRRWVGQAAEWITSSGVA